MPSSSSTYSTNGMVAVSDRKGVPVRARRRAAGSNASRTASPHDSASPPWCTSSRTTSVRAASLRARCSSGRLATCAYVTATPSKSRPWLPWAFLNSGSIRMPTRWAASAHWRLRCSVGATTTTRLTSRRPSSSVAIRSAKVVLPAPGVATARKSRGRSVRYCSSAAACQARSFAAVPHGARPGKAGGREEAAEVLIGPGSLTGRADRRAGAGVLGSGATTCYAGVSCKRVSPRRREVRRPASLPEGGELSLQPGDLTVGEPVHAGVEGVVHEVPDRVVARCGASVAAHRALECRGRLGSRVGDVVAGRVAAVLEGVVQPHPVPDLVGAGVAEVVVGGRPTGQGLVEDDDPVHIGVGGVGRREGGPTPQTGSRLGGVDVQGPGPALAQRRLHLALLWAALPHVVPGGVDRGLRAGQPEGESGEPVRPVQHLDLLGYLVVGHLPAGPVADDVHVHRHGRRREGLGRDAGRYEGRPQSGCRGLTEALGGERCRELALHGGRTRGADLVAVKA